MADDTQTPSQQTIRQLIERLYGDQAETTLSRIDALVERYQSRIPDMAPSADRFDERDTILITYGDTLHADGEHPLETLHRFGKDHLKGIIETIHILPFFPYSSDDGFSVQDYYAVNPDVGTWDDVDALAEDFGLMFDAVFNHMSAQSEWFEKFLAGDAGYEHLFMTESLETDLSQVTRPRQSPLLTAFTRPNGETVHVWTTFSADQVDFDIRYPETLLYLLDVLLYYISHGASIIRLDAIAFLWKIAGTSSIHLQQTHEVIQVMRAVLDQVAPQVILITETNVPHKENISYFGDGHNEAQMVYNFTLPPLLFHTFLQHDATILREWVNSLSTPSDDTTFFNFTASHDGIGVRPVEGILGEDALNALVAHVQQSGGRVSFKRNPDGSDSPYELNVTYVDALIDPSESQALQVKRFVLSQAIAMSLAGVPAIYIHSLLGSRNDIAGMESSGVNRRINRAKLAYTDIQAELADPNTFRAQVFAAYSHLIEVRRQQAAFHPNAAQEAIDLGRTNLFGLLRKSESQTILGLFNLTPEVQAVDVSQWLDGEVLDVISGEMKKPQISLEPYEVVWLSKDV
ncbi:MAG: sugar phosphorylase [Anaerolineaceae bacterium]|nr:sugar phosphorylase [Anaerolineaceae bacterium]